MLKFVCFMICWSEFFRFLYNCIQLYCLHSNITINQLLIEQVGKSSLFTTICSGTFPDHDVESCCSAALLRLNAKSNRKTLALRLWDTKGHSMYDTLRPLWFVCYWKILKVDVCANFCKNWISFLFHQLSENGCFHSGFFNLFKNFIDKSYVQVAIGIGTTRTRCTNFDGWHETRIERRYRIDCETWQYRRANGIVWRSW